MRRVRGVAQEVGDQLEFGLVVTGPDRVHGAAHAGVEAHDVSVAVGEGPDEDGAPVGWVALAGEPSAVLEPVEDAGLWSRDAVPRAAPAW